MDASQKLINQAITRVTPFHLPVTFKVSDAQAIRFPGNSFDAARVDRVLQHLTDPARAVSEMDRVVRAGDRIVALEPDWDMTATSGGDLEVARAVLRDKVKMVIAHGIIGRQLRRLLVEAGCSDVRFEPIELSFGDLTTADTILSLCGGSVAKVVESSGGVVSGSLQRASPAWARRWRLRHGAE